MVSETVEDGEDSKDLSYSGKQLFDVSMVFELPMHISNHTQAASDNIKAAVPNLFINNRT